MSLRLFEIDDAEDPRIEVFRDIRERDLTRRGGFIAEGAVVLDHLLRSPRFRPAALLVLRNRLAGLRDRLAGLEPDVPVYVAESPVLDRIAGFAVHRGVLAHGVGRAEVSAPSLAALAASGATVVVVVGIANHDNLGAIFRNALAFGAGLMLLDPTSCDPLYRKAIRVSVGSILTLPFKRFVSTQAMRGELEAAGYACLALSPEGATELHAWQPARPTALFLGAEGPGLPKTLLGEMTSVRIAMTPGLDSLNVATAAALALHHVYAGRASH